MHTACWSQVCTFTWLNNITFYVNYCLFVFLALQYFTRFSLIKFIYQPISLSTSDSSFVACLGSLRFLTSNVSQFKAPALLINFSAEKAGNNTWIYIFLVFNPTTSYHFLLAIFPYHLHEIKNWRKKLKKKIEDFLFLKCLLVPCLFYDMSFLWRQICNYNSR